MKTVVLSVLASVALAATSGCSVDPNALDGSKSAAPTETVALSTRSNRPVKSVTLDVPEEWSHRAQGAWTVYEGPEGSLVAIGALDPSDSNAERLAEGAKAIGATDVQATEEQATKFGPKLLPARAADGSCKLGKSPGRIGYAVVELEGERVMIIHAASRDAKDDALSAGRRIAGSLRKL